MPGSGPRFGEMTWWRKGGGSGCAVYVIVGILASLLLVAGGVKAASATPTAPTTPDVPTHTWLQADQVCSFIEAGTFGPVATNGIDRKSRAVHWWGDHQANCCFTIYGRPNHAEYLYSFSGAPGTWNIDTGWCP